MKECRLAVLTTGRADYGLLKPLWDELEKDEVFVPTLLVTGSHLSELQGKTIHQIEADGIGPVETVDLQLAGDTEADICNAIARGVVGFSTIFARHEFDFLIVLGDRYELLAACNAALVHRLPIVHLHGGELSSGAIDESIRHAVTKMSTLHFVSHEQYRKRVVQMGEPPQRVFNVGALALDNARQIQPWSKHQLQEKTGLNFDRPVLLVTYHPVTLDDYDSAARQAEELVAALEDLPYQVLATFPNADAGSRQILRRLQQAQKVHAGRFFLTESLGMAGYIAAMQQCAAMVGNSSSGILEASSFSLPVVNIGDRQAGRIQSENIVNAECEKQIIMHAVEFALSTDFAKQLDQLQNPFGDGFAAEKIVSTLRGLLFESGIHMLKMRFYDLPE